MNRTMTKVVLSATLALGTLSLAATACGGATAERAKDDVKGGANDLGNGVGTNGKGLEDGVGTKTTDGGTSSGGDKK